MRRRTRGSLPAELFVYHRSDWEGRGCHPECAWFAAWAQWKAAHPDASISISDVTPPKGTPFRPRMVDGKAIDEAHGTPI